MGSPHRPVSAAERKVIERLRSLSAHLPGITVERDGFGHSVFKVGKRSIVFVGEGDGTAPTVSVKADPVTQDLLVQGDDFERTPYIGQHGWVTARGQVRELPWSALEGLVEDAWRAVAPKRLVKRLDGS